MKNENKILVFAGWLDKEPQIGTLYFLHSRGKESYSFEFTDNWLSSCSNIFLDPDLYNSRGRQFVPGDKKIFGFLSDAAPDRWGRTLMKRKESILAKEENRPVKEFSEIDFILGVNDETRVGGLRFKIEGNENFISQNDFMNVPPFESIRKLEQASLEFEKNENPQETKWLNLLIDPGSSLGGARPKACVKSPDGSLWIAKFPSKNDEENMGAWEKTANDLAKLCGLNTTETQTMKCSKHGTTFLSKRFDRDYSTESPKRKHYVSAMTVLGKTDGASGREGVSYLDIAEFIKTNSAQPEKDLEELWNRIYFNIAISNTDDHLRNHGFLIDKKGLYLSPLFDINPNPEGNHLSLNITEFDNSKDFSLALDTASYYGLSSSQAKSNSQKISDTIHSSWKSLAEKNGLSRNEILKMEKAFE